MGVDVRTGKRDYYTRYKVYAPDADITDSLSIDTYCLGILHAKDVTAYSHSAHYIGNKFQMDDVTATIETMDKIEIGVDYWLYAMAEDCWYIVTGVAPNSHNEGQRFSSRPVNTTQISIRRAN